MAKDSSIRKVLVIGSGPIVIGQAAEFDYAGAQACRVLKEEGINVVLVNSNPATIMTDKNLADEIYLEPLSVETVERIIEKERPDGLLAGLGGQTGLTIAMQLSDRGSLKQYGVRLLGTDVVGIKKAEDRELFAKTMKKIGQPIIPSDIAEDLDTALFIAKKIGYPVIVRPAFTLGGSGGGIADNEEELKIIAKNGLDSSPITQILVEKCISGWKEIEFETMRDESGEAVIVCSMENVDPVGIHTGDSIVVAPALTLNEKEFDTLKQASLDIIKEIGIIGGCNCQFALKVDGSEYAVIEVNPRVSRSSALASKATGYPIAKVTTRLALGYMLSDIKNADTGANLRGFEPKVNYIVVKFPKWPFDKFIGASRRLGTQMKATGEVMAIAPTFVMGLMKAVRGLEIGVDTLNAKPLSDKPVRERLKEQDDRRIFTVFEALKEGVSVDEIFELTKILPYFLEQLKELAEFEEILKSASFTNDIYLKAKNYGYTDAAIMRISGVKSLPKLNFTYRIVKTCTDVFGDDKPYFYSEVGGICEAMTFERSGRPVIIVLGSGPIRIGQGIEFDYSSVHSVWTLQELGYDVVIINNNPETVSTDYDTADRLYFEPLTEEDVLNVIAVEKPVGVVVAFGGQTAIKLTNFLNSKGIQILGTSAEGIDLAEDRKKFDALLEAHSVKRPKGKSVLTLDEALEAADELGYPVLLRPSYVIGGQNMQIVHDENEVKVYMKRILADGIDKSVLIDKYMSGSELEVDVISDGKDVLIPGIMQHIERAGVHSGDSIAVYPAFSINDVMIDKIVDCSTKLALSLGTKGLVNIQYLIFGGELYVIEVNPRASRTIPYISKVTGVEMVDLASKVMLGFSLRNLGCGTGLCRSKPYYAVKVPVFSFEKLTDVNSYLGPEMKSTGEVLGIGKTRNEALYKGLVASGLKIKTTAHGEHVGVYLSVDNHDLPEIIGLANKLNKLNIDLYASPDTAAEIKTLNIKVTRTKNLNDKAELFELLESGKIDYIVYTGALFDRTLDDYIMLRRKAISLGIACFTSLDTANAVADIIASRFSEQCTELVDLNNMRVQKKKIIFAKMEGSGNDYIIIENFDNNIFGAESLCVSFCNRHKGIGGYGIALIERSNVADVKMKLYNRDGSVAKMGASAINCVAKYVYDKKIVAKTDVSIETDSGVKNLKLFTNGGEVTYILLDLGKAELRGEALIVGYGDKKLIDYPVKICNKEYKMTCCCIGNPHAVCFVDSISALKLKEIGPYFESNPLFPERINTEFVRVVNHNTLLVRVYERGNGETPASGTGAAAAVIAATEKGFFNKGIDVTVKMGGGDIIVNYTDDRVTLIGSANLIFYGSFMI